MNKAGAPKLLIDKTVGASIEFRDVFFHYPSQVRATHKRLL